MKLPGNVRGAARIITRHGSKNTGGYVERLCYDKHKTEMQNVDDIPDFLRVENRGKPMTVGDRPIVGTYTLLNTYLNICPYQANKRYIEKVIPFSETPEMKWGNQVHSAFELRVGSRKPLPVDMQHWEQFAVPFDGKPVEVEKKCGISAQGRATGFFDSDVYVRCKLDLTAVNGTVGYMLDWKTGGSKYEAPFELEIGAMMLHARYPQLKKIVGQYAWLKENRLGTVYDLSNTAGTWQYVHTTMERIKFDQANDSFEKRKGPLCAHCPVFACEHNKHPDNT